MYGELIGRIISLLFPYKCIYCGDISDYKEVCCDECLSKLENASPGFIVQSCSCGICNFLIAISAMEYSDNVRRAVAQLKFAGRKDSAPHFAGLMVSAWHHLMNGTEIDYVVPVPMHPERLKKRGYNQSLLIAAEAAKLLGVKCAPDALIKVRNNALQHELDAAQRLTNIKNVFALSEKDTYKGKSILLIDDVLTTGATVNECANKLIEGGAGGVYVLTFAAAL